MGKPRLFKWNITSWKNCRWLAEEETRLRAQSRPSGYQHDSGINHVRLRDQSRPTQGSITSDSGIRLRDQSRPTQGSITSDSGINHIRLRDQSRRDQSR
jgi:hypothetical protein